MIRVVLVVAALALSSVAAVRLREDARAAARGHASVQQLLTQSVSTPSRLVIVFQAQDCLGDGDIVQRWNALSARPALRVAGLVVQDGALSPAQKNAIARTGLRMPLSAIPILDAELVASMLGYTRTPFAVLLDSGGRVAGSFPGAENVPATVIASLVSGKG